MNEQTKKPNDAAVPNEEQTTQETSAPVLKNEVCEQELQECQKKRDEYLTGWQRERADAVNARRDYEQKLESLKEIVKEELLADFLPILDSINLAVRSVPEDIAETPWFMGIAGIGKQVDAFLDKMAMERISAAGKPFNPHEHEAMEMVDNADPQKSQTVAEELQPGYTLNGKVIRPSLVKVFK